MEWGMMTMMRREYETTGKKTTIRDIFSKHWRAHEREGQQEEWKTIIDENDEQVYVWRSWSSPFF